MNERGRNILPVIGFIILIGLVLGGFSIAREINGGTITKQNTKNSSDGEIDETSEISTKNRNKISIRSVSSGINVYTHDEEQVRAHFYGNFTTRDEDAVPYLEVKEDGSIVSVRIVYPKNTQLSISGNATLDVYVPGNWDGQLEISSVSGKIAADSITGDKVGLQTTSGGIEIGKVAAGGMFSTHSISGKSSIDKIECDEGNFRSTSGRITVGSVVSRTINAKTVSGRIEIKMIAESADIESASGEINAAFDNSFNTFKARNVSGKVKLAIPHDSEFSIEAKSMSGGIDIKDFPVKISTSKNNELKGQVGNGDGSIYISTTSGNIEVSKK